MSRAIFADGFTWSIVFSVFEGYLLIANSKDIGIHLALYWKKEGGSIKRLLRNGLP